MLERLIILKAEADKVKTELKAYLKDASVHVEVRWEAMKLGKEFLKSTEGGQFYELINTLGEDFDSRDHLSMDRNETLEVFEIFHILLDTGKFGTEEEIKEAILQTGINEYTLDW